MADHVHVTGDHDTAGAGAGAIIGIVLGVLLVLILLWFLWLRPTFFTVPTTTDTDVNIEQEAPTTDPNTNPDGDTNIIVPDGSDETS